VFNNLQEKFVTYQQWNLPPINEFSRPYKSKTMNLCVGRNRRIVVTLGARAPGRAGWINPEPAARRSAGGSDKALGDTLVVDGILLRPRKYFRVPWTPRKVNVAGSQRLQVR
jgi:hypothetical protein